MNMLQRVAIDLHYNLVHNNINIKIIIIITIIYNYIFPD